MDSSFNASEGFPIIGKIIKGVAGSYDVLCDGVLYVCSARGIFRKEGVTPLPGDNVEFAIDEKQERIGSIMRILERESSLSRPPVANVQQLLIVLTLSSPPPDFILVDKMLISAMINKLALIICVNKCDMASHEEFQEEIRGYERAGYRVVRTTIEDRSGYEALLPELCDRITIFAGQSGVGKSTILNAIIDRDHMEVGSMSQRIKRGKHTTRHVELVALKCGGYIIDSPGFSTFDFGIEDYRTLDRFYPEFSQYAGGCRFNECSHIHEPDCQVRIALGNGELHRGRYDRYAELYGQYKEAYDKKYSR
ncbi:MAG: ribosome small subunit-dependent GTPase A [Oscillospiraceae bacterium]|nr:ribosome small subunit-dependent GTPase A [Oscillospiraceae bacterium]